MVGCSHTYALTHPGTHSVVIASFFVTCVLPIEMTKAGGSSSHGVKPYCCMDGIQMQVFTDVHETLNYVPEEK